MAEQHCSISLTPWRIASKLDPTWSTSAPARLPGKIDFVSKTEQLSYLGGHIMQRAAIQRDHRGLDQYDNMIALPPDEI